MVGKKRQKPTALKLDVVSDSAAVSIRIVFLENKESIRMIFVEGNNSNKKEGKNTDSNKENKHSL